MEITNQFHIANQYSRRRYRLTLLKDNIQAMQEEAELEEKDLIRYGFNNLEDVGWREVERLRDMEEWGLYADK